MKNSKVRHQMKIVKVDNEGRWINVHLPNKTDTRKMIVVEVNIFGRLTLMFANKALNQNVKYFIKDGFKVGDWIRYKTVSC